MNQIIVFLFNIVLFESSGKIFCNEINVRTSSGTVSGQTVKVIGLNKTVYQFLSLPYAEPPIGSLRFAKPKPIVNPIEGIIDGTKVGNSCIQPDSKFNISEDCLVLNIWTSETVHPLKPVMFWLHGGGLNSGSIFQSLFNGSVLAAQDVVLVSANYRLGKFGFLYSGDESAPGNVALYDQVLAIKWVRENIHLFGGDKTQITVFGESAGSRSITAMIVSPETKGLFRRVILESGSIMHYKSREIQTKEELLVVSKQFAKRFNCTDDKTWVQCLRKVDAQDINRVDSIFTFPLEGTDFLPFSVQDAFKKMKYQQDIDILAGVTRNEGSLLAYYSFERLREKEPELDSHDFIVLVEQLNDIYHGLNVQNIRNYFLKNSSDPNAIRQAFYELFGDIHVKCPTYMFAKQFAGQTHRSKTYFYELLFQTEFVKFMGCQPKSMGICHGADIDLVFGQPLLYPDRYTTKEAEFSKRIMKLWINFARTGVPDINWTQMLTNSNVSTINLLHPDFLGQTLADPYPDSCDVFWKDYFIYLNKHFSSSELSLSWI